MVITYENHTAIQYIHIFLNTFIGDAFFLLFSSSSSNSSCMPIIRCCSSVSSSSSIYAFSCFCGNVHFFMWYCTNGSLNSIKYVIIHMTMIPAAKKKKMVTDIFCSAINSSIWSAGDLSIAPFVISLNTDAIIPATPCPLISAVKYTGGIIAANPDVPPITIDAVNPVITHISTNTYSPILCSMTFSSSSVGSINNTITCNRYGDNTCNNSDIFCPYSVIVISPIKFGTVNDTDMYNIVFSFSVIK
mmetsp:Transcript_10624/g.15558  ORF Transcript_10624/g.15558 Transcript_10624/m.15558 type:complete len:246 (-) Transcript_10624:187-924(-)